MISRTTARFRQALARLPKRVRKKAAEAYRLFKKNPHHRSLQFKQVHSTEPVYSVRIGIGYRALGRLTKKEVIWFWIGSHAEYDKLLQD